MLSAGDYGELKAGGERTARTYFARRLLVARTGLIFSSARMMSGCTRVRHRVLFATGTGVRMGPV